MNAIPSHGNAWGPLAFGLRDRKSEAKQVFDLPIRHIYYRFKIKIPTLFLSFLPYDPSL